MHSTELETQQLISSLNTALVMVDNKLTIVYANHAGEALFETGLKQLIGHPLQDFFLPGTIETTRLKAAIRKVKISPKTKLSWLFEITAMYLPT